MNLQQLRYLLGIAEQGLNLSKAAVALHTSQPGISRQIRLLEEELGAQLLVRQDNRVVALTEQGRHAIEISKRILRDVDNLKRVGADTATETTGRLVLATTHVHARYMLIPPVREFQRLFPAVDVVLRQGTPDQIVKFIDSGDADLGICTAPTISVPNVARFPWFEIGRCVLVPDEHPLLKKKSKVTLGNLASYPMINLDNSFAGGVEVMSAFSTGKVSPNVVLSATDADVIKAFVASGMGIATLPEVAYDPQRDVGLKRIDASHLFKPSVSYLWLHRHQYVRGYLSTFIQMLSPQWTRSKVDARLRAGEVE